MVILSNEVHTPNCELCELTELTYQQKRKELLDAYKMKQNYRVAIGKRKWIDYETFNPAYNLREVLNDEVAIEFDSKKKWEEMTEQEQEEFRTFAFEGIIFTGINLLRSGISFEVWEHNGKSPHLHIHNLPISNLEEEKRRTFKKVFIRKYVPLEYLDCVDLSLTGNHLIAIEWCFHWKGCYDYKILLSKFEPMEIKNGI